MFRFLLIFALLGAPAASWSQQAGSSDDQGKVRCTEAAQYIISLV